MKRILDIDEGLFLFNLRITQAYCEQQLRRGGKDDVAVLRSLNPVHGKGKLFNYQLNRHATLLGAIPPLIVEWAAGVDPYNSKFFESLFEKQMSFKSASAPLLNTESKGKILVIEYDSNIPDGASAVESEGFVDELDFPPIDTWFFKAHNEKCGGVLFTWVPEQFIARANEAIDVHFLDIIHWFEDWAPLDYRAIVETEERDRSH